MTKRNVNDLITSAKRGFTLAEVLITLAIIGVVAAMTIPTLISDYQEKVTVTKVKKMYSILSNAYSLYSVENGYLSKLLEVSENGAEEAANIFLPYLKVSKDCGTDFEDCLDIMQHKYKTGTSAFIVEQFLYAISLTDGSSVMFRGSDGETVGVDYLGLIYYDVNGNDAPNKWGHDLFQFHLYPEGIRPVGINTDKECDTFDAGCALSTSLGYGCSAWVIHKGNLDYLKCPDELTWEDSKCSN